MFKERISFETWEGRTRKMQREVCFHSGAGRLLASLLVCRVVSDPDHHSSLPFMRPRVR
jgi:hypothetical protein